MIIYVLLCKWEDVFLDMNVACHVVICKRKIISSIQMASVDNVYILVRKRKILSTIILIPRF